MATVAKEKYFEMWRVLGKEKGTQKLQADFLDAISQVSSTKKTYFFILEKELWNYPLIKENLMLHCMQEPVHEKSPILIIPQLVQCSRQ